MDNKKLLMKLDNFYLSHLEKHGTDEDARAYEQIKEMLNSPPKSGVTEEWIKEKARRLHEKSFRVIERDDAKGFIRSLVEEIHGRK